MVLARERDELIEKELVLRQLAFIMIAFRQAVLALPGKLRAAIRCGLPMRWCSRLGCWLMKPSHT
jgi:hypothetical protein